MPTDCTPKTRPAENFRKSLPLTHGDEGRKRGILGFYVGLGRAHSGARGRKKKNKATASGDGDDGDLPH